MRRRTSRESPAMNGTCTDEDGFPRHEFLRCRPYLAVTCILVLAVAAVVGTFGNVLVLVAVATKKPLRKVESIFIVNLALSDLYVTTVMDPMSIVAKLEGEDFYKSVPGLCQTIASACTVSCVTSILTVLMLSVNRYVYICKQAAYSVIFTPRNCVIMCLTTTVIGVIMVGLNAIGIGDHQFDRKSLECIWDRMATYRYTVTFTVILVWLPAVCIAVCFINIYLYVLCNRRKIKPILRATTATESGCTVDAVNMRVAWSLSIVYAVFIACWTPYAVLIVADADDTLPHTMHVVITMWAHLHPSFNWIIYYFTNRKFSTAYRQLLQAVSSCLTTN